MEQTGDLATLIAADLSTGELSDVESSLILDIVVRAFEALDDYDVLIMRTAT